MGGLYRYALRTWISKHIALKDEHVCFLLTLERMFVLVRCECRARKLVGSRFCSHLLGHVSGSGRRVSEAVKTWASFCCRVVLVGKAVA